jgi:hypothetical protein
MAAHRILSVGKEPILMASRTLVLRNAGYGVEEAHTVDKALALVEVLIVQQMDKPSFDLTPCS